MAFFCVHFILLERCVLYFGPFLKEYFETFRRPDQICDMLYISTATTNVRMYFQRKRLVNVLWQTEFAFSGATFYFSLDLQKDKRMRSIT